MCFDILNAFLLQTFAEGSNSLYPE